MSTLGQFGNDDSWLDGIAAEWLFEREEGFTPRRGKAFAEWCASDPRHAEAVARIESTMALLDQLPQVRAPLEQRMKEGVAEGAMYGNRRIISLPKAVWLSAAAALVAASLAFSWNTYLRHSSEGIFVTDLTAVRSLVLPDGSVMDMNVGSEVSISFAANVRRITLKKGEAHFQVAHNKARPFVVTAGDLSVRAVGTAFDVRLGTNSVEVMVDEGTVGLRRKGNDQSTHDPSPLVHTGEKALVSRDNLESVPRMAKVDERTIRLELTWQNPLTSFSDVPLRDVVNRFNRRNATQLVIEDADLGARKIGGMVALDQVDAFVRLLEKDGDIIADRRVVGRIGLHRAR